ncbi:MAG: hypothetical protein OEW67_12975, partial [Cyclobacteriaceae bacterium]|nr:hypothetical protein [Cyclobacteriaceae bacterium]
MKTNLYRVFLLVFLFIEIALSQAQVFTIDIDKSTSTKTKLQKQTARTEGAIPLVLPFWDDFSWSNTIPSDSLWENSNNVTISAGNGINPPTYKVATFDGIKLNGAPYSTNFGDFESGNTDSLTSLPIDLSTLTATEKSTVYLSFFYQKQGNGELPDNEDGLRVEFLSISATDTTWKTVIAPNIINGANVTDTAFHQVIQQVTGEEYFHNQFQFRIISTGRKTGSFDTWNIDYVYLNKGRNNTDISYPDRSINQPITSPFKNFTSIPITHFFSNSKITLDTTVEISVYNLEHKVNPLDGAVVTAQLESTVSYFDSSLQNRFNFIALDETIPEISQIFSPGFKTVWNKGFHDFSPLPITAESARIDIKLYIDSGDKISPEYDPFKPLDFFINDTITTTYYLKDYYAYDDGTAEKGAGVNSAGNEIAYQFPFLGSIESSLI